jgi:hypothetical protein
MKHTLEAFLDYVHRLFLLFGLVLVGAAAAGCTTPVPTVVVKHVVVAPADNLLVDCDVAAPPVKLDYLRKVEVDPTPPDLSIGKEPYPYTARFVQSVMKVAQERERQLTELNLKHYKNLDACNKRFHQIREWKAKSLLELNANKKE